MNNSFEKLFEKAGEGSIESLDEIIKRMYPLLSSRIAKGFWDPQEREDLLQEGRLEIIRAIKSFDPGKGVPLLGYLKKRIDYLYLNIKRPPAVFSLNVTFGEEGEEFIQLLESETDILEELVEVESITELRTAIEALPKMQNRVIIDLFYNDLSLSETAEINGIAYRTVVNTRAAALINLRKSIGRCR